jgi:hypothetical protein
VLLTYMDNVVNLFVVSQFEIMPLGQALVK